MLTINNTLDGYLKDVEILGNTIQNEEDLADIRSVGEKVEGQELYEIPVLSVGKNIVGNFIFGGYYNSDGRVANHSNSAYSNDYIRVEPGKKLLGNHRRSSMQICEYDINKNFLRRNNVAQVQHIVSDDTRFIKVSFYDLNNTLNDEFQLEFVEGDVTQPTPYEPYQEDKLTILSPTPLEKVGNVRDRIIEKDGVLGVEKNVNTVVLNGSESWRTDPATDNMINMWFSCENIKANTIMLCDKFNYEPLFNYSKDKECIGNNNNNVINLALAKSRLVTPDAQGFKQWLQNNNVLVKYPTTQPQFIPLPHDQQVKLRTFANKTNISFLTEIEGTIKAQVPKSLGATVNTHTEQISNLNKELDRVKKLEENTVSTVTTESDFTTVEATSNGYFEDVKLEGKTLVNLVKGGDVEKSIGVSGGTLSKYNYLTPLKNNTLYTVILNIDAPDEDLTKLNISLNGGSFGHVNKCINGISCFTLTTNETPHNEIWVYFTVGSTIVGTPKLSNVVVLEGDHTQNPPNGYIEGLKSVGQDVDEIVVSSVNPSGNLFGGYLIPNSSINPNTGDVIANAVFDLSNMITLPNVNKIFTNAEVVGLYDEGSNFISFNTIRNGMLDIPFKAKKCRIRTYPRTSDNYTDKLYISINKVEVDHISDKKRLLYYNEETQTWEKPILREWDSIEKHANGKYYYHQRSGEVVLNGSEDSWAIVPTSHSANILAFNIQLTVGGTLNTFFALSDKFAYKNGYGADADYENFFHANASYTQFRISKSKLSTQDVAGFKQWLQANNVTVVYQLAEEKVYECTNIDLITYANETNYIVESGEIVPKSTLKVHNNISNVVSLLQKKVSLLESNITKYMITQNRMQLASTYSADSVTFKVDYFSLCENEENYNKDLYNLILNNILVGKDNYDYDKMFTMILDYASWNQISWEQFDILVGLMDMQHNPPIEEIPTEDEVIEETPNEIM